METKGLNLGPVIYRWKLGCLLTSKPLRPVGDGRMVSLSRIAPWLIPVRALSLPFGPCFLRLKPNGKSVEQVCQEVPGPPSYSALAVLVNKHISRENCVKAQPACRELAAAGFLLLVSALSFYQRLLPPSTSGETPRLFK